MRKICLLAVLMASLLFLLNPYSSAQCPTGSSIAFSSQQDIDDFSTDYPGCTTLLNNIYVSISGPGINNLNGLSALTEIAFMAIENTSLPNLTGLDGLTSIEFLSIEDNPLVTNMLGLESLINIDFLRVENNSSLVNFTGLSGVSNITEEFIVRSNPSLQDFTGLSNLSNVGNGLNGNVPLFRIVSNDALQNFNGLQNLVSVDGAFTISVNNQIADMSGLTSFAFAREFTISGNDNLQSLTGLTSFGNVEDVLSISGNPKLTSLAGISGLFSIPSSGYSICNNATLSYCEIDVICELIQNYPALISIKNNMQGCMNNVEVEARCNCPAVSYFIDLDGDGFGDNNSNPVFVCPGNTVPSNHVSNNNDCNDNNPNDVDLVINNNSILTGLYQANNSINANGNIPSTSANVNFKAGNYITLNPGFQADPVNCFLVEIDKCGL